MKVQRDGGTVWSLHRPGVMGDFWRGGRTGGNEERGGATVVTTEGERHTSEIGRNDSLTQSEAVCCLIGWQNLILLDRQS